MGLSLKYRIALTVFLLEAVMMTAVVLGLEYSVAAGAPAPEMQQALQVARGRTIMIALAGMSLIALAGIAIGFLLTRRLEQLAAAAERLAAGEAGVRVNFEGRDELARLGHAFDRMADQIDGTLADLRSSEARNRVLVEHCPAAIFVFDPEAFRLVDVNQKWVELLKYPREQIVGMTPLQASPPFQAGGRATDDWARELVTRTFSGEHPTAPWILRDSTGRDFPCELQLTRYPEARKNLIIGIIYDVSERERLAKALDRRIAFEDLVVRLSARLIALKPDQIDQSINEALAEIGRFAGVDRSYVFEFDAERKHESCTYEWCASGIQPAIPRLQNLPLADFPWFMERIGKGEVLHVPSVRGLPLEASAERAEFEAEGIQSVIMVPLCFEGGVTGYMGFDAVSRTIEWPAEIVLLLRIAGEIVFSALHRKRAELALRGQAAALEQANTALARSNEELKQFAYVASHDLREPLRAIAGFSALLANKYKGRFEADADEYIGFITDAATRMHNMINDLLSYSRLDSQAEPPRACDMHQMLKLAQANLLASINDQHATVTHDVLPVVKADPTQVVQLLQNLIGNAIKFHNAAPPKVHLGVRRRNGDWEFTLSDNGIGIDPKQGDSIFQIFRRLHAREEYPGTGIGLAVCKRIVERHGGRIWYEPNEGGGSQFHFTLPALT